MTWAQGRGRPAASLILDDMLERSDVVAWRSRWASVNEETAREARAMSPLDRLRALDRLRDFGVSRAVIHGPDDEIAVWARFARLRARYRDRHARR